MAIPSSMGDASKYTSLRAPSGAWQSRRSLDALPKVLPLGIHRFHQFIFLRSAPVFDLLLSLDSSSGAGCFFKIDQLLYIIPVGKASFIQVVSMFIDASDQIIGHTCIEDPVVAVGQQINVKGFHGVRPFRKSTGLPRRFAPRNDVCFFDACDDPRDCTTGIPFGHHGPDGPRNDVVLFQIILP